jgi:hypothetical protein
VLPSLERTTRGSIGVLINPSTSTAVKVIARGVDDFEAFRGDVGRGDRYPIQIEISSQFEEHAESHIRDDRLIAQRDVMLENRLLPYDGDFAYGGQSLVYCLKEVGVKFETKIGKKGAKINQESDGRKARKVAT